MFGGMIRRIQHLLDGGNPFTDDSFDVILNVTDAEALHGIDKQDNACNGFIRNWPTGIPAIPVASKNNQTLRRTMKADNRSNQEHQIRNEAYLVACPTDMRHQWISICPVKGRCKTA